MKNKAFTLIELLAVIVILAIIALIAVPMVLNIIDNTKDSSVIRSTELYLDAVELYIARNQLDNKQIEDGQHSIQEFTKVEVNGQAPSEGMVELTAGKITDYSLQIGQYVVNYDETKNKPVIGGELRKAEYKPVVDLVEGMTAVQYIDNNWTVVDGTKKNWYNYNNQEWANAVILNNGVTKNIGDTIDVSSEVKGMFVYVPRYEYKIEGTYGTHPDGTVGTQELPGEIEINFVPKTKNGVNNEYRVHPAFTFGDEELNGIWVGKFETSHVTLSSSTADNSLGCSDESCENADGLRILPNRAPLRYNNISNFFYATRSMSRDENGFGLSSDNVDTHMMKNSEWGAVAYLSQSKYGKYGNSIYIGANKEIYQNKSYITGYSNGTPSQSTANTQCEYSDIADRGNGIGSCGGGASTTGNITGIYDMNGGSRDYIMANYNNILGDSGFKILPDIKYYDLYTMSSLEMACSGEVCYGHALSETLMWYQDGAVINPDRPWFSKGGLGEYSGGGIFLLTDANGGTSKDGYAGNSIHIVLVNLES